MMKMSNVLLICLILSSFSAIQVTAVSVENGHHLSNKHHVLSSEKSSVMRCPTWFTYDNASGQCICEDNINGIITCDSDGQKVYILACYCMTYDNQTGINVGSCFTNCHVKRSNHSFQSYLRLPMNHSNLNEVLHPTILQKHVTILLNQI